MKKILKNMNNKEYKIFCMKRYQPFFNYLDQNNKDIKYSIINKTIYIKIKRNSHITYIKFENIELPANVKIKMNVEISYYPKKYLPKNLKVEGLLTIKDSSELHYFGENTHVVELIAKKTNLKSLKNITIERNLDLYNCLMIDELPNNLKLNGSLFIECGSIKKIGKNTVIKKDVYIIESQLKELADNLSVGGDMLLDNVKLKTIKNITVRHSCIINYSKIEKIENNSFNCLNMCNVNLKALKNIIVKNYCSIKDCDIGKIENNYFLNKLIYSYHDDDKFKNLSLKNNHIKKLAINSKIFNKIEELKNIKNIFIESFDDSNNSDNSLINKNIVENLYKKFTTPFNKFYFKNSKIDKNYIEHHIKDKLSAKDFEAYFKNVLLYHADHILKKKLILDQIDKIDDDEIKKYITENSKNTAKVIVNDKKFKFTKGKIPLIYYCQNKDAVKLLYKNNYLFNEQEFNSIKNTFIFSDEMKNLYEMYLFKSQSDILNTLINKSNINVNKPIVKLNYL